MIADATQNIVTDLKSALGDLLREKINSFVSFGEVNFDESHIELTVDEGSTLDLFTLCLSVLQFHCPRYHLIEWYLRLILYRA